MELRKREASLAGLLGNFQPLETFKQGQFGPNARDVLRKYLHHLHLYPGKRRNAKLAAWDTAECLLEV